jgi:hypothetical protein
MNKIKDFFKNINDAFCVSICPPTYMLPIYSEVMQKHFEHMQILNEVNAHNKDCYIGIGSLINKEQIQ